MSGLANQLVSLHDKNPRVVIKESQVKSQSGYKPGPASSKVKTSSKMHKSKSISPSPCLICSTHFTSETPKFFEKQLGLIMDSLVKILLNVDKKTTKEWRRNLTGQKVEIKSLPLCQICFQTVHTLWSLQLQMDMCQTQISLIQDKLKGALRMSTNSNVNRPEIQAKFRAAAIGIKKEMRDSLHSTPSTSASASQNAFSAKKPASPIVQNKRGPFARPKEVFVVKSTAKNDTSLENATTSSAIPLTFKRGPGRPPKPKVDNDKAAVTLKREYNKAFSSKTPTLVKSLTPTASALITKRPRGRPSNASKLMSPSIKLSSSPVTKKKKKKVVVVTNGVKRGRGRPPKSFVKRESNANMDDSKFGFSDEEEEAEEQFKKPYKKAFHATDSANAQQEPIPLKVKRTYIKKKTFDQTDDGTIGSPTGIKKRGRGRPPKVKDGQSPIAKPLGRPPKSAIDQSQKTFAELHSTSLPNGTVSSNSNGQAEELLMEVKVENVSYNNDDEDQGFDIIAPSSPDVNLNQETDTTPQATNHKNLTEQPNFEKETEANEADENPEAETQEIVNVELEPLSSNKCNADEPAAPSETIEETSENPNPLGEPKINGEHESIMEEMEMD